MFVRSRIDKPLIFRKNGKSWTLKPHSVTLINDPSVTARELKGCYGSRIDVITDEETYRDSSKGRQPIKKVVKSKVEEPISKSSRKEDKTLDDILEEVNKELEIDHKKVENSKGNKPKEDEPIRVVDDVVPENKDTEANKPAPKVAPETKKTTKSKSTRTRRTSKTSRAKKVTKNKE